MCSKEIHSSSGSASQISLAAALTTTGSGPSGVNDHYVVVLCSGHKTMPSAHAKSK